MIKKRPIGLIILGIVFIFIGVYSFISFFQLPEVIKTTPLQVYWLIFSTSFFISGFGILKLKPWARILALILAIIKTIQVLVDTVRDVIILANNSDDLIVVYSGVGLTILFLVIGCGIIYYLTSPKVKGQFR